MPIICRTCGHCADDHFDDVCWHASPEDRCREYPDLDGHQCWCEDYRPVRATPLIPAQRRVSRYVC